MPPRPELPDPDPAHGQEAPNNDVLVQLGKLFFEKVDAVVHIVDTVMDRRLRAAEAESAFRIKMAPIAVTIVVLIVAAAAVMTYLGKLDGSTFASSSASLLGACSRSSATLSPRGPNRLATEAP